MSKPEKALSLVYSAQNNNKTIFVLSATDDIDINFGKLVGLIAKELGGKGGGPSHRCEGFIPTENMNLFKDSIRFVLSKL